MPVVSRDDSFARRFMEVVHTYYQSLLQSYQDENAQLRALIESIHALELRLTALRRVISRAAYRRVIFGEPPEDIQEQNDRDLQEDYRVSTEARYKRAQKETCEHRIREIFIQIRVIQDYFLFGTELLQADIPDYSQSVSYSPK